MKINRVKFVSNSILSGFIDFSKRTEIFIVQNTLSEIILESVIK